MLTLFDNEYRDNEPLSGAAGSSSVRRLTLPGSWAVVHFVTSGAKLFWDSLVERARVKAASRHAYDFSIGDSWGCLFSKLVAINESILLVFRSSLLLLKNLERLC